VCVVVCIGERKPSDDNTLYCPSQEVVIRIQIREKMETDKVKGILGNPTRMKFAFYIN